MCTDTGALTFGWSDGPGQPGGAGTPVRPGRRPLPGDLPGIRIMSPAPTGHVDGFEPPASRSRSARSSTELHAAPRCPRPRLDPLPSRWATGPIGSRGAWWIRTTDHDVTRPKPHRCACHVPLFPLSYRPLVRPDRARRIACDPARSGQADSGGPLPQPSFRPVTGLSRLSVTARAHTAVTTQGSTWHDRSVPYP